VRVELLGSVEHAVVNWAEQLLGLVDPAVQKQCPEVHFRSELMMASRSIVDETYLESSPFWKTTNEPRSPESLANSTIVESYRKHLCIWNKAHGATQSNFTILSKLKPAEASNVLRDMVGLTGGPVALTVDAAESILRNLVSRPKQWKKYHCKLVNGGFTRSDVMDLVKRVPPDYFVLRHKKETGKRVVIATGFRKAKYATDGFGVEPHRCLGKDLAIDALQEILTPLLAFQYATIDPPNRRDLKRRSLWVRLDNKPPKPTPGSKQSRR
jgi:hypothetical protein